MTNILLPILTLLLGQLLGYWFALRGTTKRIAAEKRAEFASEFIARAYRNLEYLVTREGAAQVGTAAQELTILGDRAGFFLSDQAATAIDALTSQFVHAINDRLSPDIDVRRDVWAEYKAQLDAVRQLLRRDVNAQP